MNSVLIQLPKTRHSREGGNPTSNIRVSQSWIPAFAGMTAVGYVAQLHLGDY